MRLLRHKILVPLIFAYGKSRDVGARSRKRIGLASLAETVAEVQHVALGQVVIQTRAELIHIAGQ